MSPFEIGLILHYYTRVNDYPEIQEVQQTVSEMVARGLLEPQATTEYGASYRITEMGKVYAVALTRVPMPVKRWVMPEGVE